MKPSTAEQIALLLAGLDLVPAADLEAARRDAGHHASAEELGQALVRRELLTGYQLERLLRGEPRGYFYGRAKILYQIGAGSFARVFRAVHCDTGGILAVKVLRSRFANDPEKRRSFQHEGEMGRLLRHPNIVAIDDVGQEDDTSYITMEFVEGQTLRELVKLRGAIDLPRALELILQLVNGLEYAHRRGVTHRDLKASNVIVSSTGEAKLVDFGLAGVDESGGGTLGRVEQPRTIDYATLEKLAGMRDDSVRSDIYFMGTIAYLTVCGASPLAETRDRNERANPSRFKNVQPLAARAPDLPRDVVDLVMRMMHLDPLERWQTVAEVKRALETIIGRRAGGAETTATTTAAAPAAASKGCVMLVESDEKAQQTLRQFFMKLGYRVLLTENPQRALVRFSAVPPPADALVLCSHKLGQAAVDAFNTLSSEQMYAAVPALLLVGARQDDVAAAARTDGRRRVVRLPMPGEELGRVLRELVPQSG
jgi:hypothetical protein